MGGIKRTMKMTRNTDERKCTISVVAKETYHDNKDGEVVSTTEIHADKDGHVELWTMSNTNDGNALETYMPLTLTHIPILSKMLNKVTEELGADIQRYVQEDEEIEQEYMENHKWDAGDIESLFELSGFAEDFCVTKEDDKIIYGGWNRVYLYPDGTIKVSESHSRPPFLEVAREFGIELT